MTHRQRPGRQDGFILLETVISFVIIALSISVVIMAGAGALHSSSLAARYQQAALRAQSHLDEAVNANRLMPGDWSGQEKAGFAWRVRITPSPAAMAPHPGSAAGLTLYKVEVWETWRDGLRPRAIHLVSERIAAAFRAP